MNTTVCIAVISQCRLHCCNFVCVVAKRHALIAWNQVTYMTPVFYVYFMVPTGIFRLILINKITWHMLPFCCSKATVPVSFNMLRLF